MTSSINDINTDTANKEALKELLKLSENSACSECNMIEPKWVSIINQKHGVFLCIVCAGLHRSIGTHICRVKSVDLDSWKASEVETMKSTNNLIEQQYWESQLPKNFIRPTYSDSIGYKEAWIRCKYDDKAFIPEDSSDAHLAKRLDFTKNTLGWLFKKGKIIENWKRRYVKFVGNEKLEYFKGIHDKTPCGCINLKDLGQVDSISEVDGRLHCFIVSTPKRRYLLSSDTYEQMFVMIQSIRLVSSQNKSG